MTEFRLEPGRPTRLKGTRTGDTVVLKDGRVVLLLRPSTGVVLNRRPPKLIKLTGEEEVVEVVRNTKQELELFNDLGVSRDRVWRYLALPRKKRRPWLRRLLEQADAAYYEQGEPIMTDYEYDVWRELLGERQKLGPTPVKKVDLPAPAGSLHKAKSNEELLKWLGRRKVKVVATPKLDGVSVVLHYKDGHLNCACTRGDGLQGQDITEKVKLFRNPPPREVDLTDEFVVRGEAVLSEEDFAELKTDYRNPRNTVAGVLNAKEINEEVLSRIKLYVYAMLEPGSGLPLLTDKVEELKLLKKMGFTVPKAKVFTLTRKTDLEGIYQDLTPAGVAADGLVVEPVDREDRLAFETGTYNPKWARAWKPELKPVTTTVEEVEWNVSRHGKLKPRVRVEPVEFGGVTVTYATGNHAQWIKENRVGAGAVVSLVRSGDVIPEIVTVLKPGKVTLPTRCPECGTRTVWQSVDLVCPNKDCPGRASRSLQHFLAALEVEGAGPGTARALMQAGITTPESLLKVAREEPEVFQEILGPKKGRAFVKNLLKRVKQVDAVTLAYALNLGGPGVGKVKLKQLLAQDEEFKAKLLTWAEKHGVSVVFPWEQVGPLTGKKFAFTGFRDKKLEDYIQSLGGEVVNTVNKETTAVFAKDPRSTSRKAQRARELGVPIIPKSEAARYLHQLVLEAKP